MVLKGGEWQSRRLHGESVGSHAKHTEFYSSFVRISYENTMKISQNQICHDMRLVKYPKTRMPRLRGPVSTSCSIHSFVVRIS